jgi:hypothetical protein
MTLLVAFAIGAVSGTPLCSGGLCGALLTLVAGLLFGFAACRACGLSVVAEVFSEVASARYNPAQAQRVPKLDGFLSAVANATPADILWGRRKRGIWRDAVQDFQSSESLSRQVNQRLHTCGRIAQFMKEVKWPTLW